MVYNVASSRRVLELSVGALILLFLLSTFFIPAHAATTYTMTLQTDAPSYSGMQQIKITGVISPAVGLANTAVIITVKGPSGVADVNEVFPSSTDGSFSDTSVPGGSAAWTSGTYAVNATWGGNEATASMVATFTYSTVATTTTTTSTATVTSTSTSTTGTSSTTSTITTSAAPEFPSSVLAILSLVGMALVAVLSRRVAPRPSVSLAS